MALDTTSLLMRRGLATMLVGVLLPPAGFVVAALVVPPSPGMDGYVPAFLGGMAGAVVGFVVLTVGFVLVLKARRQRQVAAAVKS